MQTSYPQLFFFVLYLPRTLSLMSPVALFPCHCVHTPDSHFPRYQPLYINLALSAVLPPSNSLSSCILPFRPSPLFSLSPLQLSYHFCLVHPLWENNSLWEAGEEGADPVGRVAAWSRSHYQHRGRVGGGGMKGARVQLGRVIMSKLHANRDPLNISTKFF